MSKLENLRTALDWLFNPDTRFAPFQAHVGSYSLIIYKQNRATTAVLFIDEKKLFSTSTISEKY